MKKIILAFAALLFLSTTAISEEKYLCITSLSTGYSFSKDSKEWTTVDFKSDDKYIVSRAKTNADYKWTVKSFKSSFPLATCENDFNSIGKLYCDGLRDFRMTKHNGRFILSYLFGYWDDNLNDIISKTDKNTLNPFYDTIHNEGDNTPYIQIGECTA